MRVSRLEIFGFKSFMERLVLPLEGGITGVVGPNGCGKSNIVDALRWVLGETRASQLRGGVLEDVIFNGTDKLRPLGLAEVTLTLRAEDASLWSDLQSPQLEVEKVIKNLSKEFGVPDEVDEATPPKLRVISGGAASAEDQTAEKLSEATEAQSETGADPLEVEADAKDDPADTTVLARFGWLQSVNEVQITRRLYRSGESEFFINRVPCRLKDIKDFFRAVGLGARAYTVVAQGEVSRIVTAKPEDRRMIIEEAAGVVGFRDKIGASNRRLDETHQNVVRLKDVIGEVERSVGSLKRQAQRAQNRQRLKDELRGHDFKLFVDRMTVRTHRQAAIEQEIGTIEQEVARLKAGVAEVENQEHAFRSELYLSDTEGDSLRSQIDSLREELINRARRKSERQARIHEIRAFNMARETEIRRLEERKETLQGRSKEATESISELSSKDSTLQEHIKGVTLISEDDLRMAGDQLKQARERLREKESEIRSVRDKVVSTQSSLNAIQEQLIAASPLQQLKSTLEAHEVSRLVPEVRIFVEGLTVPPQYARAVQSVLAERAAFLVSKTPHDVAQAFLQHQAKKPVKGMGIGVFRASESETLGNKSDVPFPHLLSLIEVQGEFQFAAQRVFADVFVAETAEQAFMYFQRENYSSGVTVVTVDGDILTDYSFFSLRHDGGLIQLQNRAIEQRESLRSFEQVQDELHVQRESLHSEVIRLEGHQAEMLKESEKRQRTLRELTNEQASVRGRLNAEERVLQQLTQDGEKILSQIKEIQHKIAEGLDEIGTLEVETSNDSSSEEQEIERSISNLQTVYQAVDVKRKEIRGKLSAVSQLVQERRKEADGLTGKDHQLHLEVEKLRLEMDALKEKVITEYGDEVWEQVTTSEPAVLSDEERVEAENESHRIRNRIAREGDVDPTSIERYDEEAKRFTDLTQQLKDLEESERVLRKTIERLEELSRIRYLKTFKAVNKNFSRLVPQLFGGGKGHLEILDPTKPLESGVEILMRPPGKKPKSIDLLSGGEKALCATALIFAMFLERPSPLCVLDEVDAPLDEANLIRFLTMVREMSNRTQFLLVTHNKRSMATSDNLIGVTMQEPGSSKVISVSLQEAFAQVA